MQTNSFGPSDLVADCTSCYGSSCERELSPSLNSPISKDFSTYEIVNVMAALFD